jgi:hypothetical protein
MGYTQYFTKKELVHDQKTWDKFLEDTLRVSSRFKLQTPNSIKFIKDMEDSKPDIDIQIGDGMGDGNDPTFNQNEICFNGVDEDSHETFRVERDHSHILADQTDSWGKIIQEKWKKEQEIFGFTKTNRKPYDLLVTAVLALYKHHFGDKVEISGDGGFQGFKEGVNLVNETLNYKIPIKELIERD